MMTGDRVEAAAKALAGRLTAATQVIVTQRQYVSGMSIRAAKSQAAEILAAADEADRVAGVVRVDTRDAAMVKALDSARRLRAIVDNGGEYWPNYERVLAWDVLDAFERLAALAAAAGAAQPEETQP